MHIGLPSMQHDALIDVDGSLLRLRARRSRYGLLMKEAPRSPAGKDDAESIDVLEGPQRRFAAIYSAARTVIAED